MAITSCSQNFDVTYQNGHGSEKNEELIFGSIYFLGLSKLVKSEIANDIEQQQWDWATQQELKSGWTDSFSASFRPTSQIKCCSGGECVYISPKPEQPKPPAGKKPSREKTPQNVWDKIKLRLI